ncbi:uncharacterized protein METZ01_LOCUS275904, partial [marine metagenome]
MSQSIYNSIYNQESALGDRLRSVGANWYQRILVILCGTLAVLILATVSITAKADDDDLLIEDDLLVEDDLLLEDDSLLDDDDSLLEDIDDGSHADAAEDDAGDVAEAAAEEHESLFAESRYPSAGTCGTCHPKQYEAWSVSQHSYSQLSPAYLSLNNKINELANGSNGDFCLRCHNPVGANLGENSFDSNLGRHPTSREGDTCVVCHRLNKAYNKASGRLALVEGGLTEIVFGPMGNDEMERVLD